MSTPRERERERERVVRRYTEMSVGIYLRDWVVQSGYLQVGIGRWGAITLHSNQPWRGEPVLPLHIIQNYYNIRITSSPKKAN
jgi:hypothetical protein